MSLDLSRIEARLREQLCPDCVRYTSERTCSLPPDRKCALFKNLSVIVDVVRKVHSHSMGPYLDATRAQVCSVCEHEDGHGTCPMRDGLDCALNTYLPIIVDEVERELDEMRHERSDAKGKSP